MSYSLKEWEQETIITFNESTEPANIFTYNAALIRKLDSLAAEREEIQLIRSENFEGYISKEYELPKKWIKIYPPRVLSEETKARLREQGKAAAVNFKN